MAHSLDSYATIEVNINGEHTFFLNKNILASYSNLVKELLPKHTNNMKLIFDDFPGGPESFELVTSFCYNNGTIDITPSNIFLLHCASTFMEITSLITKTKSYLTGIHCWTWLEFANGLKQCQTLFPFINKSPFFQDFLNTLLGSLILPTYGSSSRPSSSNTSSFRFSSSDSSSRSNTHLDYWKFDDLAFLNIDLFEKLIKSMIFLHFDHPRICSFIFHYQKSKFLICCSHDQKCKLSETNVNLLSLLNDSALSFRALLDAFGMSLSLDMKTREMSLLENLLGSQLDEFTINDLLVRCKKTEAFDVDLILRLIKIFLLERRINGFFEHRLKKVGFLMDLFMLEVAPDPFLKPSKFLALAIALPDFSRESHDKIYHAVDLYIEVHQTLDREQTMEIWNVIDLNKLSKVTMRLHLTKNSKFLPYVKLKQLKISNNKDLGVHKSFRRAKNTMEDEKRGTKIRQMTQGLMLKRSRVFDSYNAKSLPRLCH